MNGLTFPITDTGTRAINTTSTWAIVSQRNGSAPEGCLVSGAFAGGGFIPWDNPDNIISQDVEQAVDTAVGALCLPILFLISAPTNILNMLVFWKQGLKERINLCLFYLSLVDFVHMLHAFFCNVDRFYLPFNQPVSYGPVFQFIVDHRLVGFRSLTLLSGFVSMLIACDRCFCVIRPLRSQTVLSTRTTGLILATYTAFSLTGSFLIATRWGLACVFDPETSTTSRKAFITRFYIRNRFYLDIVTMVYGAMQPLICVTVIVATTIVTSVKLKAIMIWREQTSSKILSSQEITLTRMLVAVSVLYIICSLPSTTLAICTLFIRDISLVGRYYNLSILFVNCYELTSYINATFNFFVYCSIGSKYRGTLKQMCKCFVFQSVAHDVAEKDRKTKGFKVNVAKDTEY